jgi:transcriptional regulator with XRE-family HTH domain
MLAAPAMGFGDWLRAERKKVHISQGDLAERSGYSKGYISQVENEFNHSTGKATNPSAEAIRAFVRALRSYGSTVTEEDGFRSAGLTYVPNLPVEDEPPADPADDPLARTLRNLGFRILSDEQIIGAVPASDPDRRTQEHRGTVLQKFGAHYMVEVEGDSMTPYYADGDILIVRKIEAPDPGDVVIALVYGDSVCKLFTAWKFDPDTGETIYTLSPTNHKYREIRASDVEFQGVVVGKFVPARRIRWPAPPGE